MDQETLVDKFISDGSELLERLVAGGFEVAAAGWVRATDDTPWYLYVVSPAADDGTWGGYGVIQSTLRSMTAVWIRLTDIKLIRPSDPIGRAFQEEYGRYPGPWPAWQASWLGSVSVESAYIYPKTMFQPQPAAG